MLLSNGEEPLYEEILVEWLRTLWSKLLKIGAMMGRLVTRTAMKDSRRDHSPAEVFVPRAW